MREEGIGEGNRGGGGGEILLFFIQILGEKMEKN